jgi:uncharacterized protein YwqG
MPDRRRFFAELFREAAGVVQDAAGAVQEVRSALTEPGEADVWEPPAPVPAKPATRVVEERELLALAQEQGLGDRAADIRRSARAGMRLTRAASGGRSWLGGSPLLPPDFEWPTWSGRELAFVGQLDLAEVGAVDSGAGLPRAGSLLFFFDLAGLPSGLRPGDRDSCRVVLVSAPANELELDARRTPALRTLALELSRELTLPGAWSFQAEALELSLDEIDAWDELRNRLARAQGVELEETSPDRLALHRLLGHHDEIGREVEVDCELASAGLNADDVAVYHESRADHEVPARQWRLLLQLSADESIGTPSGFDRLFICIRERDLVAGNFDGAWALLR